MKNEQENINPKELRILKLLAEKMLSYNSEAIEVAIKTGELKEVSYE